MQTVLITGGTGFVGKRLSAALLQKGYKVIILSRSKNLQPATSNLLYAYWDVERQVIDNTVVAQADYIIHLAGAGVADKRWSNKRKQEIVNSRVMSSQLLINSLQTTPNKAKAVISASATGWYGPDEMNANAKPFVETDAAYQDFLGNTCQQWEQSIDPVCELGKRLVKLRIGIVLGNEGGAFKEFLKPLKFGLATALGSGRQMVCWIHVDDVVNMFIYAIENEKMNGVYNAVAPQPVTNKALITTMAKTRNKFYIPVKGPSFILKLMVGEMSVEVLKSVTVSASKIEAVGFTFEYPAIKGAVRQLLNKS